MAPAVLGYWDIRGIVEPVRFLLRHVGKEYEDKLYKFGPTAETFREEWYKARDALDLDFPNLPYYIDGDLKITHCMAIMRYLARKYGLDGESEEDKVRIDLAEQQGNDLRWNLIRLVLNPDFKKLRDDYVKNLGSQLKDLEGFLGDRSFVTGDKVSYADFIIYEVLDHHLYLEPGCLSKYAKLQAYVERVENLPNIKKYRASASFKAWPLFGHMAQFGGTGQPTR